MVQGQVSLGRHMGATCWGPWRRKAVSWCRKGGWLHFRVPLQRAPRAAWLGKVRLWFVCPRPLSVPLQVLVFLVVEFIFSCDPPTPVSAPRRHLLPRGDMWFLVQKSQAPPFWRRTMCLMILADFARSRRVCLCRAVAGSQAVMLGSHERGQRRRVRVISRICTWW